MINVAINGASGKMGQVTVRAINDDPDLHLAGSFDHTDDLQQSIQDVAADVVVDFTTAAVSYKNTRAIIEAGAHPVIGTTGFNEEQIEELTQLCTQAGLGGIIAPNFSIGALLMIHTASLCAEHLKQAEIIELHHDGKKDAPSGTALKTANVLKGKIQATTITDEMELLPGARGATQDNIHIHSVRLPGFLAHQQVIFGGLGESLTIRHDTTSREAFMPGVLLACKKVVELKTLIYGLEHLLFPS